MPDGTMRSAPQAMLFSLPHVSVSRADDVDATSSMPPTKNPTAEMRAAPKPKSSSSQAPKVTNRFCALAMMQNIVATTSHARPVMRRGASCAWT